jgi:hypothetical protein
MGLLFFVNKEFSTKYKYNLWQFIFQINLDYGVQLLHG